MRSKLDLSNEDNKIIVDALSKIQKIFEKRALTEHDRKNFAGSAKRIARMYNDIYWDSNKITEELVESLNTTFPVHPNDEPGIIVHGPITINSMCPHHFMPVRYHAYVGYVPAKHGQVLGTSKLDRIPIVLSKRFILQENLAADIVDVLYQPEDISWIQKNNIIQFHSEGSICTLIGIHTCEACRGIEQDARTMVTERRGCFKQASMEERFFHQISILDKIRPFGN